jgi:hypothetical protein
MQEEGPQRWMPTGANAAEGRPGCPHEQCDCYDQGRNKQHWHKEEIEIENPIQFIAVPEQKKDQYNQQEIRWREPATWAVPYGRLCFGLSVGHFAKSPQATFGPVAGEAYSILGFLAGSIHPPLDSIGHQLTPKYNENK